MPQIGNMKRCARSPSALSMSLANHPKSEELVQNKIPDTTPDDPSPLLGEECIRTQGLSSRGRRLGETTMYHGSAFKFHDSSMFWGKSWNRLRCIWGRLNVLNLSRSSTADIGRLHIGPHQDSLAERSKAVAQGAIPKGRGFEPHSCHSHPVWSIWYA